MRSCFALLALACVSILLDAKAFAAPLTVDELKQLDANCADKSERKQLAQMVERDQSQRFRASNAKSSAEWNAIHTREDWEKFRDEKIKKLRASLGRFVEDEDELKRRGGTFAKGKIDGDGFEIIGLMLEPLGMPANLYRPIKPSELTPGIVICHSHHSTMTQGEVQDMGMTWARQGCQVLVIEHPGYGERRQHPFSSAGDYAAKFPVSRQDYYFRYDASLQLYLAGESLMGWMVADLRFAVSALLQQPHIDPKRILLLGGVAGGGDPAAVTAALDNRIAAVGVFNFGGPQPETRYPLPDDAETWFDYAGGGSWESTRNLNRSAADGFLPWVIVGSVAPRGLIYGHEFSWDRQRDPVWKRFEKIYGWYEKPEQLAVAHGTGTLKGQPPEASHCNTIGEPHRAMIYPTLHKWFDLPAPPVKEYRERREAKDLVCATPTEIKEWRGMMNDLLKGSLEVERSNRDRSLVEQPLASEKLRKRLGAELAKTLGSLRPDPNATATEQSSDNSMVKRIVLQAEQGIRVPILLLVPEGKKVSSVVIGVSQAGKAKFLSERAGEISELLAQGVAVALVDVRGTGETSCGDDNRGRTGSDASFAASELMLGGTLLGARLRDLRAAISYLQTRQELDIDQMALWGESFAPTNAADIKLEVPHGVDKRPRECEPLGGLLAMLTALYDDRVQAVYAGGALSSLFGVYETSCVYLPSDVVVPGLLRVCDIDELAATLAPTPLMVAAPTDANNRSVNHHRLSVAWQPTSRAYGAQSAREKLVLQSAEAPDQPPPKAKLLELTTTPENAAKWLGKHLK